MLHSQVSLQREQEKLCMSHRRWGDDMGNALQRLISGGYGYWEWAVSYVLIQQIFVECLPDLRHYRRPWGYRDEQHCLGEVQYTVWGKNAVKEVKSGSWGNPCPRDERDRLSRSVCVWLVICQAVVRSAALLWNCVGASGWELFVSRYEREIGENSICDYGSQNKTWAAFSPERPSSQW